MIFDVNIAIAHAIAAPVSTQQGRRKIDFEDVLSTSEALGATSVTFPLIKRLAEKNLGDGVVQVHRSKPWHVVQRLHDKAERRLTDLFQRFTDVDPIATKADIKEARGVFQSNPRKMSTKIPELGTGKMIPKDPVPEDEDLEIIVKASDLDGGISFIVSFDEHFWGYAPLIKKEWGHVVIDPRQRPYLTEEWRAG